MTRIEGKLYLNDNIAKVGCRDKSGCLGYVVGFATCTVDKLPMNYRRAEDFVKIDGNADAVRELANKVAG